MGLSEDRDRQVLLEHSLSPRNRGRLERPTIIQAGHTPGCGDRLELHLLVEGGIVRDARFGGHGCAISQASASLMTDAVRGRTLKGGLELARKFHAMLRGAEPDPDLDDLAALRGVVRLPARARCASLAWRTFEEAGRLLREAR